MTSQCLWGWLHSVWEWGQEGLSSQWRKVPSLGTRASKAYLVRGNLTSHTHCDQNKMSWVPQREASTVFSWFASKIFLRSSDVVHSVVWMWVFFPSQQGKWCCTSWRSTSLIRIFVVCFKLRWRIRKINKGEEPLLMKINVFIPRDSGFLFFYDFSRSFLSSLSMLSRWPHRYQASSQFLTRQLPYWGILLGDSHWCSLFHDAICKWVTRPTEVLHPGKWLYGD